MVIAAVTTIDFDGSYFTVTEDPAHEVNLTLNSVDGLSGVLTDGQDANKLQGNVVSSSFTPTHGDALIWSVVHGWMPDHTVFQVKSEKSVASGYCELDASIQVPLARIPATIARDLEVTAAVATHAAIAAAHHAEYTDTAARAAVPFATYIPFGSGDETFLP